MSALEDLVASLKRVLGVGKSSPAGRIDEASRDRPPPAQDLRSETPVEETPVQETPVAETPVVETLLRETPVVENHAIPDVADQVAEIRALLAAMSEPAVTPHAETEGPQAETEAVEAEIEVPEAHSELVSSALAPTTHSEPATAAAAPGGSLVLSIATPPTTFVVAKSAATLGRGEGNTIRLDDLSVSRRHARIAYRQPGYWLSDLGSMGGTWVGGVRLDAAQRIAAGDVIDVGHYRLTATFAGEPKASGAREPNGSSQREPTASTTRRRPSRAR